VRISAIPISQFGDVIGVARPITSH